MSAALLSPVHHIIHAVATAVVPETASLDALDWAELDAAIAAIVARRDPRVRQQLVAFLRLLQFLPLARYGRALTTLGLDRRRAFLESIERSRILRLRRGFWGIRTLIFRAYYARPQVARAL